MPTDRKFLAQKFTAFAAVYLIWGSTYLAIRFVIETLPPFSSAGLRFLIAGLLLYWFARYKQQEHAPSRRHWISAVIAGGFLLLGGNGCVVWAEYYVPSGLAALFIAVVPLWMVLLQWRTDRVKPSPGIFVGIASGFLGVWLLMAPDLFERGAHSIHLGGALLLLLASFSWSIGSIYTRRAHLPKSAFLPTAMQMIGGGILLLMTGLLQGEYARFHWQYFSAKSVLALLYLISFGSLGGFTAYIWLLRNVGVARTSTYAFVNPLVAIVLGGIFASEKLDTQTAVAALFVLVAVIVITIYHKEPKSSKK